MSGSNRSASGARLRRDGARRSAPLLASRFRSLLLTFVLLVPLSSAVVGAASADPQIERSTLSADQARDAGVAIELVPHMDPRPFVEVVLPPGVADPDGRQLLDLAPSGTAAAVAAGGLPAAGTLAIARADGSQVRVEMPGLLAAAFAADEQWLAVVDGLGRLWRVSSADGAAARIADGPFVGPLSVDAAGGILLQSVSSVEAPFRSVAVRVDSQIGTSRQLSSAELVYGITPMPDGELALVVHDAAGTSVRMSGAQGETTLVALGQDAVHVAVARDRSHVAFQRPGEGVVLLDLAAGISRTLADATHPRFAPDGGSLLVDLPDGARLVGLDGEALAQVDSALAAFPACEGCAP
jgi:hypothetical protein